MRDRTGSGPWADHPIEAWGERLGVPRLEVHSVLGSTNARLRELFREGAPCFTTVIAEAQSRGRGREGKAWHSPAGVGLWLSVLLALPRGALGSVLPLAVGVAAARTVEQLTGRTAGLKWPNDVLIDRRKVAGILCEAAGGSNAARPDHAVVGVGINLRSPPGGFPAELADSAGVLEPYAGRPLSEPEVARLLLDELRTWAYPAPIGLSGRLRMEWESRDLLLDRKVRVASGAVGVARGVSPEGALRVGCDDGTLLSVRSGGVRLERPGKALARFRSPPSSTPS